MDLPCARVLAGVCVLVPALAAPLHAQAVVDGDSVERLIADVRPGHEAETPCDRLSTGLGRALLAKAETGSVPVERLELQLRLALRAGECAGAADLVGAALNDLSDTLLGAGDFDGALAVGRRSVAVHESENDPPGLAEAWNRVGNAQERRAEYPAALESYQRAVEMSARASDRVGQARTWNNMGNVHRARGDLGEALADFTRAFEVFDDLHDTRRAAVVTNNIALVYFDRGDYAKALDFNARAIELNKQAGSATRLAAALDSRANIYRVLGSYRQALDSFQQALALRSRFGDELGVIETTHNIGLVHFSQGDYELAITAYKRSLRLNRKVHHRSLDAEALLNIGAAAWRLGERDRAIANLKESLAISRAVDIRSFQGEALKDLGLIALAETRTREASGLFSAALAIYQRIPDQAGITDVFTRLAATRIAEHDLSGAIELAGAAVENAKQRDQPELLWEAQTVLGVAYRRLDRTADARAALRDAIADIEALSAETVAAEKLRLRFMENKLSPYHELIGLAAAAHDTGEAFALAERSKARVLSRLVATARHDEDASLTSEERAERRRLSEAVTRANVDVEQAQSRSADASRLTALVAARTNARDALAAYETTISARHPDLRVARGSLPPITLAGAGPILKDTRSAVVEYVFAEDAVYGITLTRGPSGDVSAAVRTLRPSPGEIAALSERLLDRIASRDFGITGDARRAYAALLGPFETVLAGKTRLIIVPDGPLWNVPFQALRGPRGYVIETAAVSYAPSLTVLQAIEAMAPARGRPTVLAVGRSKFDGTGPNGLEDLPQAEDQVRRIAAVYGPDRSAVLLGADATEARFKAAAPHYSVLHLATHGVLDESSPLYSHLVLTADSGAGDDGLLESWELMRLRLSADLVVLAACDTARGRIAAGEGVVGTMWALFAAGARSMVVTQFRIEGGSTTTALVAFHERIAAGVPGKAAQLQSAALQLLHTPRYAHPYYWAGLMLVGDPD